MKGCIFDLFGTLVTNNIDVYNKLMSESFGLDRGGYKQKVRGFVSTTDFETPQTALNGLLGHLELEWDDEKKVGFLSKIDAWKRSLELYPGAIETLERLKKSGVKIGIVSNNNPMIESVLDISGLRKYADCVVLSHKCGYLKPDREMYQLGVEALGVDVEEIVMVGGQLEKDVLAPIAMGMQGVLFDPENNFPDYAGRKISSLRDLL